MNDIATARPIACTLDTGSFKERLAWIADLNARSLTSSRRADLALTLEYRTEALDDIRELVRGEQACCAFLDFDLDERADRLLLTITAPEAARDAADMLFEQFCAKGAAAVSSCGCTSGCQA
ncbi:MAG: hypothetical protein ABS76_11415 [Pelagibacterium sp. SCN 64-44]|nr:MAG: hypothetical protein ABS76_11415 [Pelagibacterium sp. SCN 64-44]